MQKERKKRRRFIILLLCELLFIFFLLEVASRLYWKIKHEVPFFQTDKIIFAFYPELKHVKEKEIMRDNAYFDILLLGGSVLNKKWSNIETILLEKLVYKTKRKIRIHNVAQAAHTSLDSYFKYKRLNDKDFELVIFYHGINETRANNVPPSMFKDDYSHYSWYKSIHDLERYLPLTKYVSLPYTARFIGARLSVKLGASEYVPTETPKQSWLEYGSTIKTAEPFKKNLTKIIDISSLKGERLLLMTFAYYLPEGYEEDKFKNKPLDYTLHLRPVELWGKSENVIAGMAAHNLVIQQLSRHYENVYFADQYGRIPKDGEYFNDVCHLTYKGSERFADNIVDLIIWRMF